MRVVVAGRGFLGGHLAAALGAEAVGREGLQGEADVLVWAAGGRSADPELCLEQHVRAPLAAAARCRRIIYFSSGEVYGAEGVPFSEETPLAGQSPYARAKIQGERALQESGREVVILRLPIAYGPGQTTASMFVPAIVGTLRRRERFAMTPGGQTRDFLFVDDLLPLVRACLEGPAGVYNGGTGREVVLADAARLIARLLEAEALLDVGALKYRENEQMRYCLESGRAEKVLGWKARVGFDEGIRRTIARWDQGGQVRA